MLDLLVCLVCVNINNLTLSLPRVLHVVQANSLAVQAAAHHLADVLAVQVMQLCQCLDSLSSQLRAKDNVDRLKAKQQLRGRQRQARLTLGCSN